MTVSAAYRKKERQRLNRKYIFLALVVTGALTGLYRNEVFFTAGKGIVVDYARAEDRYSRRSLQEEALLLAPDDELLVILFRDEKEFSRKICSNKFLQRSFSKGDTVDIYISDWGEKTVYLPDSANDTMRAAGYAGIGVLVFLGYLVFLLVSNRQSV